ncbi:hypothetical protein [Lentzea albida]|uniref:Uncharacterized protein n=1 Tax=Lentzea albida TaxID=65499 RepID=A0A1H9WAT9_9PSEU|nr:hypothetical protein [Lentzea albida]SES30777.1 hypothetical protein SAMN04488000_121102 [Lentzea albida]
MVRVGEPTFGVFDVFPGDTGRRRDPGVRGRGGVRPAPGDEDVQSAR